MPTKPKKPRDAEITALAEAMLRELEVLRESGGEAYPPRLRELAARTGGTPTEDQVRTAAGKKAFTAKAVVTEKVGRIVSLDSPVHIKGDEIPLLSQRMVRVLDAQRRLGGSAYPLSLERLAELCGLKGSDSKVTKAAVQGPMAEEAFVVAKTKPAGKALAILKTDAEHVSLRVLPALLRFALQPATTTVKKRPVVSHAFPLSEVAKRFVDGLRPAIVEAMKWGAERDELPPGVAWVVIKGEANFFLTEHLHPKTSRGAVPVDGPAIEIEPAGETKPSSTSHRGSEFATAFRDAFERLDRRNGSTNFVKLFDLRHELAGFLREEFDAGLDQLRRGREFTLDRHEGVHASLTSQEREAGLWEEGSLLVYVSRR